MRVDVGEWVALRERSADSRSVDRRPDVGEWVVLRDRSVRSAGSRSVVRRAEWERVASDGPVCCVDRTALDDFRPEVQLVRPASGGAEVVAWSAGVDRGGLVGGSAAGSGGVDGSGDGVGAGVGSWGLVRGGWGTCWAEDGSSGRRASGRAGLLGGAVDGTLGRAVGSAADAASRRLGSSPDHVGLSSWECSSARALLSWPCTSVRSSVRSPPPVATSTPPTAVAPRCVAAAMTWRTGAPTRPPLICVTWRSGGGTVAGDPSGTGCPDGARGGPAPEVCPLPRAGPLP
ncbi:MAG: hypothetical protein JOY78_15410 [Pseudonocardia sp.]|nr:hypothetical protein [Pseudonocardia sp.]